MKTQKQKIIDIMKADEELGLYEVIKPIHKFNNGKGATLCHKCSKIISTGLTKELYCSTKCKEK